MNCATTKTPPTFDPELYLCSNKVDPILETNPSHSIGKEVEVNGKKNGETLKLFQDYAGTKNGEAREKLLGKTVARVLSILPKQEEPNGDFRQLIEARRQYPTAFQDVVIVVCRNLEIPTGLRSLLDLYAWTRDLALREKLLEIREEAFCANQWDVLEPFAETNLMQEFADLAQKRRSE